MSKTTTLVRPALDTPFLELISPLSLGTPFCLPWDDPTALGMSSLLCSGPHYLWVGLPSPGGSSLLQDHPRRLVFLLTYVTLILMFLILFLP